MILVKRLHFVGIGGTGMNGIAEVLLNKSYKVTGSDLRSNAATESLEALGAEIHYGHAPENVGDADVVVISSAVHQDNPEVLEARSRNIPVVPRAIMLAELMRLRHGIAIAGTHGKTTTTSLVTSILERGGLDPTFVIGGRLNAAGANAALGQGKYIVAEADESDASFLYLTPVIAVITNIDLDHMETYGHDLNKLKQAFVDFAMRLPFYGKVILCIEDENVRSVLHSIKKPRLTYGFREEAQIRAIDIVPEGTATRFTVVTSLEGIEPFEVKLNLPGKHNVLNALAAIAVGLVVEVDVPALQDALKNFKGVGRRFTIWGESKTPGGKTYTVVDDYGHHPNEIAATIAAARTAYPERNLMLVFQPHRYTRTKDCFDGLVKALSTVDKLVLCDIYSAGEDPIPGVDGQSLYQAIEREGKVKPIFAKDIEQAQCEVDNHAEDNSIVLVMGPGSIGSVPAKLIERGKKYDGQY
ncbi:MAG: UDP-N-acetylmuramate--L-alanine ligase [Burkholderiales bacterium]|nr:UDP-N-acetylmuramate--L-alanine ligase [Burkholderiales bacterium]